jgi:hypothetical protein
MADFGSMSADQINASMGFGPGGVGNQSQALFNNLYGPQGFGGQTDYYSAQGAAYGLGTGGFGGTPADFSGSRGSPAYDYGSLYSPAKVQSPPAYDYGSMYQAPQYQPDPVPQSSMNNPNSQALLGYSPYQQQLLAAGWSPVAVGQPSYDYGSLYQAPQQPAYDYTSLYQQPQQPAYDYTSLYQQPAYTPDYGASLPGQPYYPGYFDSTFGEANSQPQQTGFNPYNTYGQPGAGGGGYNPYASTGWWAPFVQNVGPEAAQQWLTSQGVGAPSGGGQPQVDFPQAPPTTPPPANPTIDWNTYFNQMTAAQQPNFDQQFGQIPGQPYYPGYFDNTFGATNSQPQQTGFSPFNSYNQPGVGGGSDLYSILNRVGMSMSDWVGFSQLAGPEVAQQWLTSQGGGDGGGTSSYPYSGNPYYLPQPMPAQQGFQPGGGFGASGFGGQSGWYAGQPGYGMGIGTVGQIGADAGGYGGAQQRGDFNPYGLPPYAGSDIMGSIGQQMPIFYYGGG